MYAVVEMDYESSGSGCCYGASYPTRVRIYNGIDTAQEYKDFRRNYSLLLKEAEKLRKAKKIKPRDAHKHMAELRKEVGCPDTLEAYLEGWGVTCQEVAFEID